jgi:cytochrome b
MVVASYVAADLNRLRLHALIGEALLSLVIFRFLWGFWGSKTALFSSFLVRPSIALRHLRYIARPEPDLQVGHNPAGGWMVLLLLTLLLALGLTGLYTYNDLVRVGALTRFVPWQVANTIPILHAILFQILLAVVALHVLFVLMHAKLKRQNLLRPMFTGKKHLPPHISNPQGASNIRALLLLLGAAAAVAISSSYL